MIDTNLPESVGHAQLSPTELTSEQQKLCKKLDEFHAIYKLKVKPSDMFKGALFAIRSECTSNPDAISQAANSLREILYPFYSLNVPTIPTGKKEVLNKNGSVKHTSEIIDRMGRLWGTVSCLAHHGSTKSGTIDYDRFTVADFHILLNEFETVMLNALARQTDVHAEIDDITKLGPEGP